MADLMPMVHKERQSLGDYLESLTPEQWKSATWCHKWNVQQLVGHLIGAAQITAPHFFKNLATSGFNFSKAIEKDVVTYSAGSPSDVLARYRAIINSNRKPPGPSYVALGEIMVHGEDLRRALGTRGDHPVEHVVTLAPMYVKTGRPLNGKTRAAGLKLRATDIDWTHGDGPEVSGPAMSLILAMVGRTGALADLSGEGLDTLRSRL